MSKLRKFTTSRELQDQLEVGQIYQWTITSNEYYQKHRFHHRLDLHVGDTFRVEESANTYVLFRVVKTKEYSDRDLYVSLSEVHEYFSLVLDENISSPKQFQCDYCEDKGEVTLFNLKHPCKYCS